jgi:hypothetical protein
MKRVTKLRKKKLFPRAWVGGKEKTHKSQGSIYFLKYFLNWFLLEKKYQINIFLEILLMC